MVSDIIIFIIVMPIFAVYYEYIIALATTILGVCLIPVYLWFLGITKLIPLHKLSVAEDKFAKFLVFLITYVPSEIKWKIKKK